MAGQQIAKRIPLIKFPVRRGPGAGKPQQAEGQELRKETDPSGVPAYVRNSSTGGRASIQPKRTPISKAEIEAVLLGGGI